MTNRYKPDTLRNTVRRQLRIRDLLTVPVIFANGRDDDLPGFRAAIENKRVFFRDRIYEPGEAIKSEGHTLAFSCGRIIISDGEFGTALQVPGSPFLGATVIIKSPPGGRDVDMRKGVMGFGLQIIP